MRKLFSSFFFSYLFTAISVSGTMYLVALLWIGE